MLFDHSIHWSNHPLRPEFLESTYYLYKATKDDHYLQIAKNILNQLEKYAKVECGYAALSDVKTKKHEDRIDSFVYAETFKYLYLMFAEDDKLLFDMDDFIFSTEAHLIPLKMEDYVNKKLKQSISKSARAEFDKNKAKSGNNENKKYSKKSCPSLKYLLGQTNAADVAKEAKKLRESILNTNEQKCQNAKANTEDQQKINEERLKRMPLRAGDFVAGKTEHMAILKKMGINLNTMEDGRVQLVHKTGDADNFDDAEMGMFCNLKYFLGYLKNSNYFRIKTNKKFFYKIYFSS